jgi:hypothetical protein
MQCDLGSRSGGGLIADDREPAVGEVDGFLFIHATVADPKFRSPYGWLVPGLIYFRNRTALNDPLTLSRIFADVFTIQETSLDRLLAPAVVPGGRRARR